MLIDVARTLGVPMVVTNDIHYARLDDAVAQDILLCVGRKKMRSELHGADAYAERSVLYEKCRRNGRSFS